LPFYSSNCSGLDVEMTHDFKAALEEIPERYLGNATWWTDRHHESISFALRLADRIMQEPDFITDDYDDELFSLCRADDYRGLFRTLNRRMIESLNEPICQCNKNRDLYGGPYTCECKK